MVELDILMEYLVKGYELVLPSKGLLILLETSNCCVSRLSNGRRIVRSRKFDPVSAIRLNFVGITEVKYHIFIIGRQVWGLRCLIQFPELFKRSMEMVVVCIDLADRFRFFMINWSYDCLSKHGWGD